MILCSFILVFSDNDMRSFQNTDIISGIQFYTIYFCKLKKNIENHEVNENKRAEPSTFSNEQIL